MEAGPSACRVGLTGVRGWQAAASTSGDGDGGWASEHVGRRVWRTAGERVWGMEFFCSIVFSPAD